MLCHEADRRLHSALANMTKERREEDTLPVPGSRGEIFLAEILFSCAKLERLSP